MAIASALREALSSSSMIRKMFEEGAALKKQYGADKVFDFSIGNPDLEPPPAFYRVVSELAEKDAAGETPGVHGYMPNAGYAEVREELAKKISLDQRCAVPASHVVMSAGAAGGLNVVFKSILNPGDEVIVPKPYFMEYRPYVGNHGGILVEAPCGPGFDPDLSAIEKALSPATAALLINSPHNPTGRVYPAAVLSGIAALLRAHGRKTGRYPYLVADEPYREIVYDGIQVPPVLCAYEDSIVVTSYSKSLSLPGERIGCIAAGPGIRDSLLPAALIYATRVLGFVNAPALMQRVVARLSAERAALETYARRRDAFMETLDAAGIGYVKPEGAFYLFAKTPGGGDGAFSDALKKRLILGVPGSAFGAGGWIRFAYCVDEKIIRASSAAFKKAAEEFSALIPA